MEKLKLSLSKHRKTLVAIITTIVLLLATIFGIPILFPPTPPTGTSISRVQGNARNTGTTTTLLINQVSVPTSGNLNVLTFTSKTLDSEGDVYRTITSITQTNVVWAKNASKTNTYVSGGFVGLNAEIWVGVVSASASANISISLTGTGDTSNYEVGNVCEYSGLAATGFFDQSQTSSGTSAAPATGTTATTTQASELWIGVTLSVLNQTTPTYGFTLLDGVVYVGVSNAYLENIVSATGAANSSTTIASSQRWAGCIVTLKAVPTVPTYIIAVDNPCPSPNANVTISVNWTSTVGNMSVLIFGTNNTGSWIGNQTVTLNNVTSFIWNITIVVNSNEGAYVQWQEFGNDTGGYSNQTSVQTLYVWIPAVVRNMYTLGNTAGFGHNAIIYNGGASGHLCIYYAYQNSSTTSWSYWIAAQDINTSITYQAFTGIYSDNQTEGSITKNDRHYAPYMSVFPNGSLVIFYGHDEHPKYIISTYQANATTDIQTLISNWGTVQECNPSGMSLSPEYPTPVWFNNQTNLFYYGNAGNISMTRFNGTAWENPVVISQFDSANIIYFGLTFNSSGLIILTGNNYNTSAFKIGAIYSVDMGKTWKCINGSAYTIGAGAYSVYSSLVTTSSFSTPSYNPMLFDENGKLFMQGAIIGAGYDPVFNASANIQQIIQYNTSLGNAGIWTQYNCTDAVTGGLIYGSSNGACAYDFMYSRPAFWGMRLDLSMAWYVRIPDSDYKFYAAYNDTQHNYTILTVARIDPIDVVSAEAFEYIVYPNIYGLGTLDCTNNNSTQSSQGFAFGTVFQSTTNIKVTASQIYFQGWGTVGQYNYSIALYYANNTGSDLNGTLIINSTSLASTGAAANTQSYAASQISYSTPFNLTLGWNYTLMVQFSSYIDVSNYNATLLTRNTESAQSFKWILGDWNQSYALYDWPSSIDWTNATWYNWVIPEYCYEQSFGFKGSGELARPDWSNAETNTTHGGKPILFSMQWVENRTGVNLSGFILETNNTGIVANETWTNTGGLGWGTQVAWGNYTLTLNSTFDTTIQWREFVNDTYAGWTVSTYYNLTVETYLDINWNNVPASPIDIGHTLGDVNASLNFDSINWMWITVDYQNGTQWSLQYGTTYNAEYTVTEGSKIWIDCLDVTATWTHTYE